MGNPDACRAGAKIVDKIFDKIPGSVKLIGEQLQPASLRLVPDPERTTP